MRLGNHKTFIIAEVGVNHNGSLKKALKLVDIAASAGVNAVKFQTFKAEKLVSKNSKKADYQKKNMLDDDDSQLQMLKNLELDSAMHDELISYCIQKGIKFLSTPFDLESIILLKDKGIQIGKIPSAVFLELSLKQFYSFTR